jgi:2-polyprenyl-6-methoxyphenol hydroxylase-like FAD-dependent oxidoreductase
VTSVEPPNFKLLSIFWMQIFIMLANSSPRESDLVIGADGMGSKIRRLAFPDENSVKPLEQYTFFFTTPYQEADGTFAQWYNAPGGRCILLRPDSAGYTRAYLSITSSKPAGYYKLDILKQKGVFRVGFEGGWLGGVKGFGWNGQSG